MVTIGLEFRDLTKFADDADLKKFIVDYVADAIIGKVNDIRAAATKAGDVAITDRGVSISVGISF